MPRLDESTDALSAAPAETGWYLLGALAPGQTLTQIAITTGPFIIGRRPQLSLTLPSPLVSARHAEILAVGERLFIRDLGSRNGTFVNRIRIHDTTPLGAGDHIELADTEFRVEFHPSLCVPITMTHVQETMSEMSTIESGWVLSQVERLISRRAITPHFQEIIDARSAQVVGYEALARSSMPGLEKPASMFAKAQLLHREVELSILCRDQALAASRLLPESDLLFLNTHPAESLHGDVLPSIKNLQKRYPTRPLVIELHEGAVSDLRCVRRFIAELQEHKIKIAYDDFGAGQSRLLELIQAPPNFLKFDIGLIRKIHNAPEQQQRMLKSLVEMVHDIGTEAIAEGIERPEEAECCRELGFDYLQGYLFGRPWSVDREASKPASTAIEIASTDERR